MFEGTTTSNNSQKLATFGIFIFVIPNIAFSILAPWKLVLLDFSNKVALVFFFVIGLIGAFISILAYRLFKGFKGFYVSSPTL